MSRLLASSGIGTFSTCCPFASILKCTSISSNNAQSCSIYAVTTIMSIGGFTCVGYCVWNSGGTCTCPLELCYVFECAYQANFALSFLSQNLLMTNPTLFVNQIHPALRVKTSASGGGSLSAYSCRIV